MVKEFQQCMQQCIATIELRSIVELRYGMHATIELRSAVANFCELRVQLL